jgi:hypothetical protein
MRPGTFQKGHAKLGGRRKGSVNKKMTFQREAMEAVFARLGVAPERIAELSPLQMMLACGHLAIEAGDRAGLLAAASAAAPYMHPRLSSSDVRVKHDLGDKSDEELLAELAGIEARIAAAHLLPMPAIELKPPVIEGASSDI